MGLNDITSLPAAFGIYNADNFISDVVNENAGGQTREQIRGKMFGDALMKAWVKEGVLGLAVPTSLLGVTEGVGGMMAAATLTQRAVGMGKAGLGVFGLFESGASLTGYEVRDTVSVPMNGVMTVTDVLSRDFLGSVSDVAGWIERAMGWWTVSDYEKQPCQ